MIPSLKGSVYIVESMDGDGLLTAVFKRFAARSRISRTAPPDAGLRRGAVANSWRGVMVRGGGRSSTVVV